MKELKEEWRDIENYPNYQVSNLGRVKSKERYTKAKDNMLIHRKDKILKLQKDSKGYLYARLYNENGFKAIKVHLLVAKVFIKNKDNKPTVDHIDRNKVNNNVNNLRWATYKEQLDNRDVNWDLIKENMRKLGKSKKALMKRWHKEQFNSVKYEVE